MPGFVPIQSDTAAHGLTGPLTSLAVVGGFADAFTAVLSGLLQPGRRSASPSSIEVQPAELPIAPSENAGEVAVPVAAVNVTLPGPVAGLKADKVTGRSNPVPDDVGKIPDTTEKAPDSVEKTPDGAERFSDAVGKVPDTSVKSPDGIGQVSNDSGKVPERASKTQADLDAIPDSVGKAPEKDHKVPNEHDRRHTRADKTSDRETQPLVAPIVGQSTPVAFELVPRPDATRTSNESVILTPPRGANTSAAAAPPIDDGDKQKSTDPRQAVPQSPGDERPAKPTHTDPPTPQADANTGKLEDQSDAVFATAPLTAPSNVPQAHSPVRPLDQAAADPGSLAHQVAPPLVGLLKTSGGIQSVTIHLQPSELGQVQIRVDRTMEGVAHIDITADRPETLALLKRDEPMLQQTLDQAGVLSNGRSVSFQVAVPEQIVTSGSRADNMAPDSGSSGQQQSGGAWRQNGDGQRDPGNGPGSEQGQARARWFRAGLDITA